MQKFTIVVVLLALVVFDFAYANDHTKREHEHEHGAHFSNITTQRCSCDDIPYSLFAYEGKASRCIGGCGGRSFAHHQEGHLIRSINVCSTPNNGIHGILVALTSGQSFALGEAGCGDYKYFVFNTGELLTGNLVLSDNGAGQFGYIGFTTNQQRNFSVGNLQDPHNIRADGRALSGILGRAGSRVNSLGFFITKKVRSSIVREVKYPTLSSITSGLSPRVLAEDNTCNNNNLSLPKTFKYKETNGEEYCWSLQTSFSLDASFSVTAGVPIVAQHSSGFKWAVGQTNTYDRCTQSTQRTEVSTTLTTPPYNSCKTQATQFNSAVVSIPWTGTRRFVFTDGTSYVSSCSGVYTGKYVTKTNLKQNCTPIKICSSNDDSDDVTTTGAPTADDDEDDSVSFELPPNEPKTELLQNIPVSEEVTA